jgi:uncharacterized protein YjbJ (UPF0337 family)
MGLGSRFHNAAGKLHGRNKDTLGHLAGSDRLKAGGKQHHLRASLKTAGEKVRDAFRRH